jgi:hypothetical protein
MGDFRTHLGRKPAGLYPLDDPAKEPVFMIPWGADEQADTTWYICARKKDIRHYEVAATVAHDAYVDMYLDDDAMLDDHLKDGAVVLVYRITESALAEKMKCQSATK